MDNQRFSSLIVEGKYRWENRELLVSSAVSSQVLILTLLENMQKVNEKESVYSARILELAIKKDKKVLLAHLDKFCHLLKSLQFDGSIRAAAKIIEIYCVEYYIKYNPQFTQVLTNSILEQFTEVSFDWMIADKSIAIQAHSMYSLYLLGHEFDWIHPELVLLIDRKLPTGSVGFQNRGKKILKAIKTKKLLKLY